ncbi:DNA polymerase III subunit delta [Pectinatus sottacetonis]|uniref:DNA polymerase III subunit delta n=1 Tax=Pectinatus sottacetonis TaxID=1002795 RepID=UPI0018C550C8|nr:DNA polymerase III subunit delta [Pectinatus sottacetonis]
MQYKDALRTLQKNDLKRLYLIAGEEKFLTDKFFRALIHKLLPENSNENSQTSISKFDDTVSINSIIEACSTLPFFNKQNIILVHNNNLLKDKKSKTAENREKQLLSLLANIPDFTTLILETDEKPDKRRKIYKAIDKYGCVVETNPIRAYNISEWLNDKFREMHKRPDTQAYHYLLSTIGLMQKISLGFLDKELDKLSLYTDKQIITKNDLINILSGLPEISVFALAEAVGNKNVKEALFLLEKEKNAGANLIKILVILTRHINQLWKIKYYLLQGLSKQTIARNIGLVPFIAEKLMNQAQHFDIKSLRTAIVNFADADYKIKSGQDTPILFEDIIIRLCEN